MSSILDSDSEMILTYPEETNALLSDPENFERCLESALNAKARPFLDLPSLLELVKSIQNALREVEEIRRGLLKLGLSDAFRGLARTMNGFIECRQEIQALLDVDKLEMDDTLREIWQGGLETFEEHLAAWSTLIQSTETGHVEGTALVSEFHKLRRNLVSLVREALRLIGVPRRALTGIRCEVRKPTPPDNPRADVTILSISYGICDEGDELCMVCQPEKETISVSATKRDGIDGDRTLSDPFPHSSLLVPETLLSSCPVLPQRYQGPLDKQVSLHSSSSDLKYESD